MIEKKKLKKNPFGLVESLLDANVSVLWCTGCNW